MNDNEILELATKTHLVEGWKVTCNDHRLVNAEVQWEPVNEVHFKQCLISYTNEVIRKAKEDSLKDFLKDVTITSKTNGEVVAVTLTDEDYSVYKVLWTKEKK